MEVLSNLFSQYSIETLILLVLSLAIAFRGVSELWDYFYNKIKKYFSYQSIEDQKHNDIMAELSELKEAISSISGNIDDLHGKVGALETQAGLTTERLQENTRTYLIDKHHYFCYEVQAIDDLNLQSLERRYLYYKAAGGNSFIDGLMEEIRALPRIAFQNQKIVVQPTEERSVLWPKN